MGVLENNSGQEHQEHIKKNDFNKYKKDLIDKIKEIIEDAFNDFKKETKERKKVTKDKIIDKFKKYLNEFESLLFSNKIQNSKGAKKEENLEPFYSYEIEKEYTKLTNEIKNYSRQYDDKEGDYENKNVSFFYRNIGIISREAYNQSNLILKNKFEQYKKEEKIKLKYEKDFIRNEFSCWIKFKEKKESDFYKELNNYDNLFTNKEFIYKEEEEKKYLIEIYKKLTILYIHCMLSFPIIKIYFYLDDRNKTDFLHNDMIDWTNQGTNRKVNFIFLPCLVSNGRYLSSGQFYVFTYKDGEEKTFRFEKIDLDFLLTVEEFNIEKSVFKAEINDNTVFVTTDYNFDDNLNLQYMFKFQNIKDKTKGTQQTVKVNNLIIPNGHIFEECVLLYNNKEIEKIKKEEKINK